MGNKLIGVDLGGTKFEAGRIHVSDSGTRTVQLEEKKRVAVNAELSADQLIECLFECIQYSWSENVLGIGIGVPGLVNPDSGEILDIQNLPAWKRIGLQQLVEKEFGVAVHLNNDVNCFALGSYYHGAGKPYQNVVAVSLGTGLGCGVIIDGKLYNGLLSGAGEIGMIPYKGKIVESYSGSFFFQGEYGSSAKGMHQLAKEGNRTALEAFEAYGKHLAEAVRMILFAYAPEAIVFGGSISSAFSYFEASMRDHLSDFPYPLQLAQTHFIKEEMTDLPLIGSAMLAI